MGMGVLFWWGGSLQIPLTPGWWFGTWVLFSHRLGIIIIPTDELIFFREVGWNHQSRHYLLLGGYLDLTNLKRMDIYGWSCRRMDTMLGYFNHFFWGYPGGYPGDMDKYCYINYTKLSCNQWSFGGWLHIWFNVQRSNGDKTQRTLIYFRWVDTTNRLVFPDVS